MLRNILIAAAGVAALSTTVAVAQTPGGQVIGVPRAVSVAEATTKGKALEAELDYEKGRLVYEVKSASAKGVHEVHIDAMSGEIVSEKPLRALGLWREWVDADQLNAVRAAPTALPALLTRIEAERGRVSEVSLERERGQTFYQVELADGGRDVLIDPRTGAMRPGNFDD